MAGGNLALIYFNAKKTRLTLEEIDELYPNLVEALANHPGIGVLMVRSRDHGLLLVGKRGINFVDEGRTDGEDPMALYGEFGVAGFKRLDEIAHVGDVAVISFYDPETEEIAAFEELIGAHGGLGGAQTRPFLLYPADWELDLAPLVGAPMVYQQLRRWMEQHLGLTFGPRPKRAESRRRDQPPRAVTGSASEHHDSVPLRGRRRLRRDTGGAARHERTVSEWRKDRKCDRLRRKPLGRPPRSAAHGTRHADVRAEADPRVAAGLRVEPGRKVRLARDFDPSFRFRADPVGRRAE